MNLWGHATFAKVLKSSFNLPRSILKKLFHLSNSLQRILSASNSYSLLKLRLALRIFFVERNYDFDVIKLTILIVVILTKFYWPLATIENF